MLKTKSVKKMFKKNLILFVKRIDPLKIKIENLRNFTLFVCLIYY